jgi:hypothetical protein
VDWIALSLALLAMTLFVVIASASEAIQLLVAALAG